MPAATHRISWRMSLVALMVAACANLSCTSQELLAIMPGVINDPQNLSLRRSLLAFGTGTLCEEMQKRSIPLTLRDGDPVIGRFYATSCMARDLANNNLFVQFTGYGYAWSNLTQRIAFEASAAIEYEHDFRLVGSTMYIYFQQRSIPAQDFKAGMVEQPTAGALGAAIGQNSHQLANAFGSRIMATEIARGFTVIREEDGTVSFGLGIIPVGEKPTAPYRRTNQDRLVLVNERTEIHQNQRDFVGPLDVSDDGALYITMNVDGATAVDVMVVRRPIGDQWLHSYTHEAVAGPPPAMPLFQEAVYSGQYYRRTVNVPKGQYYLVIDNTATAGSIAPSDQPNDDRAAAVNLAIEVGDAP